MAAPRLSALRRAASTFSSADEYLRCVAARAALPSGFAAASHRFEFRPAELPTKPASMALTLITADAPTPSFAAMFTSNAFPGAPVIVGRARLAEPALQTLVINNKISNVCAPGGVADSEEICAAVAKELRLASPSLVLPCSTGVIGWKLPVASMLAALPSAAAQLQRDSILPAAQGIMTTDMYPKVRRASVPGTEGSIVGIAKGAGMIEPNLATMLVYILTDVTISREDLRACLPRAVEPTFNALSIDSDQSTSDMVVAMSSNLKPMPAACLPDFQAALRDVCAALSEDIVRNGEGVQHVMRVHVTGAPTRALARAVGKSVVNSPLFKCAVAGNDPNVGRLVAAIGKCLGAHPDMPPAADALADARISMAGVELFSRGQFWLTPETEKKLVAHLVEAQLWESRPAVRKDAVPVGSDGATAAFYRAQDVSYASPVSFPPHERMVDIEVHLGMGDQSATILGADLTHEYVAENADYRS